jgi:hypothetical protein
MNHHSVSRALRAFAICAVIVWASACGTAVAESFDEINADELPASARVVERRWQSSDFPPLAAGDGWIAFPGRVHLKVHHPLPARPTQLLVYIAFDRSGVGGTLASGNVARIEAVGDDGTVTLHNATDEDFYVRLALE